MQFNALYLLIPAAAMVWAGVWGLRNGEAMAKSVPLDERTQDRRRRTYRRGSIACFVAAGAFVLLIVLSFR